MSSVKKLKKHIFVCVNERIAGHPRGCCKEKQGEEVLKRFKESLLKRGLNLEVRAQRAGCLDICEEGASVVVYPEGVWYGKVSAEDVEEIIESHVIANSPVERLRVLGK